MRYWFIGVILAIYPSILFATESICLEGTPTYEDTCLYGEGIAYTGSLLHTLRQENIAPGYIGNNFSPISSGTGVIGYWGSNYNMPSSLESSIIGYWGTHYNSPLSRKSWVSVGFLGDTFTGRNEVSLVPVGSFYSYQNQDISFPEEIEKEREVFPLISPWGDEVVTVEATNSPPPESGESCNLAIIPTDIELQLQKQGLHDVLSISWTPNTSIEHVTIIRNTPHIEELSLGNTHTFDQHILIAGKTHRFTLIFYGDCNYGQYADPIEYLYTPKETASPLQLIWKDETLSISGHGNTPGDIRITCSNNQEKILLPLITRSIVDTSNLSDTEVYRCIAEQFSARGALQSNEVIIGEETENIPPKEALTSLGKQESLDFLSPYINFESPHLSYGDLGIILSHSYAPSIAVSGKDFSLRVWKSLGVFQNDTGLEDTVTRSEFYNIVDWISAQTDIQDMIYETIDKNTLLTIDTLTADLQVLSAELALLRQIEDEEQHESMKSCILGTSCSIPQKYIQEMKQTPKTTARSNNAETITRATYSNYMSTLYASFGDEMRKSKGYTDESYSTFIQILVESVGGSEQSMQETLSYESYIRMNRYLLETEKLYEQIQFLVEHHVEDILILYEKLDDAERLLEVLREFLIN